MEHHRKSLGHALLMENTTLLESSPLRRRSVIAQRSTPAPIENVVNDDKTERSGSRRSLGLSGITRMTVPQIRDGIAECIKLNTQNKINIKNAFSLSMIDFMEYMVKNRDEGLSNLQIASTTLDVSAKIYGLRVDSLHQDTMKMVGHLDKQSQDDHNNNDGNRDSGAGGEDDNNPNGNDNNNQNINSQSDRIKKKKKSSQKILITIDSLQTKPDKLSLEPPMFGDADCQTTDMLYQVMLPKHCNKNLNLHPYKDVYFDEEITLDKNHDNVDAADEELSNITWPVIKSNGSQNMMSMFENFSFLNWDPNDNESVTSSQEIMDNLNESLPFNLNASLPVGASEDGTGGKDQNSNNDVYSNTNFFDINDDYDDDEEHVDAQFQQVDRVSEKIIDVEKVLNVVGKKTSEQLEYTYIRDTVNIFQAGPSTWTVKNLVNRQSKLFGPCRQDGAKKKKEFTIEYSQLTADNVEKNFATLTRNIANNKNKYPLTWRKEKLIFEMCNFYDSEKTIKYNQRDERYLRIQKTLTVGGVDGAGGDNINDPNNLSVSYQSQEVIFNNDQNNDDEDDGDNDNGADHYDDNNNNNDNDMIIDNNDNQQMNQDSTENNSNNNENVDNVGFSQGAFVGDNLVEAPKLTEKIYIPFSQRAKKLDMRNLKKTIWKSLDTKDDGEKENYQIGDADDADTTSTSDQHVVKDIKQFSDIFVQLPNKLNKNDASELTFPLAFVSLLHLANEKNLRIISNDENSDLSIYQDIH